MKAKFDVGSRTKTIEVVVGAKIPGLLVDSAVVVYINGRFYLVKVTDGGEAWYTVYRTGINDPETYEILNVNKQETGAKIIEALLEDKAL